MLDNFLKRFEKLENKPPDAGLIEKGLVVSRRFERLEIGNKKIEFSITDTISPQETAPPEIDYYFYCPYCGMANTINTKSCAFCHHNLETILARDFQEKSKLLKRCSCGTMNKKERISCWICGKALGSKPDDKIASSPAESDNTIILNIDGEEYKSTDANLPLEISLLMAKIRREGYSKELLDQWLKQRNSRTEERSQNLNEQLNQVRIELILRSAGLVIFVIFIILQLRACAHYLGR